MPASPYVSRINQIDAAQLDEEIYKVLRRQAKEVCKYQPVERIDRWQAEIDAVLKFFVWHVSLHHGKSTFGQQLLNLHYENISRTKSLLYLILAVVPAYVRDKAMEGSNDRRLKSIFDRLSNAVKLIEFLNLLFFLHRGTQARAVEFLCGIKSGSITAHKPRSIGYSYMTRELLWHGLMELFTIGLPMINFHCFKHKLKKLLSSRKPPPVRRSFPTMHPATKCAHCQDAPILPSHAGCEHLFCYYCLQSHFTAMNEFQCPECSVQLFRDNMKMYETISAA